MRTVLPQPEPGHAILRVTELEAPPEGLTLSIQRQQGPDSHLADDGWRRTEAWLLPAYVERARGALEFQLGPEICDRLAGIATVRLRVKEPEIGVIGMTIVAWPQMLTSGAVDPASRSIDDTVRLRRAAQPVPPPPAPPFEFPPEPAPEPEPAPIPELRAERLPMPPPRSSGMGWLVALLLLIAIGGAGYYAYTTNFHGAKNLVDQQIAALFPQDKPAEPTPAAAPSPAVASAPTSIPLQAPPPKKSIRDTVDEYLATRPAPEAMLAKAKEYAQAGELNGAFLLWRRAAEAGSVEAQLQVAGFYDPVQPQPQAKNSFTPDGARAAEWYERAALAGNAEAQRKYGLLLAKGGAGLSPDPPQARVWLQQAAQQNDADAKKALDALPK